jgi:leader peptidase (prepilin peptidase)/N-methyltransferase
LGDWRPLNGLGTAAVGLVIGGGIGWAVRIVATAVMGKEAFGTGDIHMMAAAGCVAGWPVVLIGFVLCCLLALFGWLVALPFKRTRAIPLGPWLSLAFLIVVLYYDPIIESRPVQNVIELFTHFPIAHR